MEVTPNATALLSARSTVELKIPFYARGGQLIIPAFKVFVAKVWAQMVYETEI